jgi:Arc/MetJ family transcription regulator
MPTDPSKWEMVDDAMAEVMRRMTPSQKFAIVGDLLRMARGVLWHQIENEHRDWEAEQIKREVARQISLGVEPFGCDLAAWLRLHADEFGDGPWAADAALLISAGAGAAP